MSRMETYTASISLGEESAQMWTLNKRLEAYLSRVKALEEENELLRTEIHQLKGSRSNKSMVRKYHDEMMILRDALDDGLREMTEVESDRDSIYQEIEYVKELCLQEKQAQEDVKKELSESKRLLEEEKRAQKWLKERLIQLEQEVEDILKTHEEDKALMEMDISSYSQRLENFKVAPTNFKPVNVEDYANQLSQIWQGAVQDYKNEVSALETNLSQSKENLKKVLDENKQSQVQLQNLDIELQNLKDRKEMVEELLAKEWLEQQEEETRLQHEIENLEKQKQDLRVQIAQVLEDRQQLMHLKMSLSLEVATYRSLLEAESTRLYTPSADYKSSSSFSDSLLELNTFKKSRHENTKPLVSRDSRLSAKKKQSAETSSTDRYLNVKSTSFSNRASSVTKEFQKVSSVLQSQGLDFTKVSSPKAATTLPPLESNLGDVYKKSKEETISHLYSRDSSQSVSKQTVRKETDVRPVVNGNGYNTIDAGLKNNDYVSDAKGAFLPPTEVETQSVQTEGKHIQVISDFVSEDQQNFVEAQNKDNDTHVFAKTHQEKIQFGVSQIDDEYPGEGFRNIDEEHLIEKQDITGQIVSCQRVYVEKEELVEPLEYQNMEASIKVNKEEFRKVLDFSKPNTQDLDEPNVLSSDGVSDQGIEFSPSQDLDFDTKPSSNNVDIENASHNKEDINQVVDEEMERLKLNKDFELSHAEETSNYIEAEGDQDEEVIVDQNLQVLSSIKEDSNQVFDDGQNITKDIHEQKSEMEQFNVYPASDTEIRKDIQEYNDSELDQQSSRQDEDILEVEQDSDGKLEYAEFDQERQVEFELSYASKSRSQHLNEEDFKTEIIKEEEDYEDDYEREEHIINAKQNSHNSTNIEQSSMLAVKEVYQSDKQVLDVFEEIQLQSQEEKNNFELNDREQDTQTYVDQQRPEIVRAPEEIPLEINDTNQEESDVQKNKEFCDQMDEVQKEQLSEDVLDTQQPALENLKNIELSDTEQDSQQIDGDYVENKPVVETLDREEGDILLEIHPDSKQEELHNLGQEESVISNEEDDVQKFEKEIEQIVESQSVQSAPEHNIQSSEGEELERDEQLLETDLVKNEEGDIKTSTVKMKDGEDDKEDMIVNNYELCTTVEYTKSINSEVIVQSINKQWESFEEENVSENERPKPIGDEEDSSISENEAEKEQEQGTEHYQIDSTKDEYKENTKNEEDKQLEESDVELNIVKYDASLLQETESAVERQSEVSTDMEQNVKVYDHQESEVDGDQPSDRETNFHNGSEDLVQSDGGNDHEESPKAALTTEEYTVPKDIESQQSARNDHDNVEDAQSITTQESQLWENETNVKLDEGARNELEEKMSFYPEGEEVQESYHQEERKEDYHQEVEGQQDYHIEGKDEYHQDIEEGKECYYQEEGKDTYYQEVEESFDKKVEEDKESHYQEEEEEGKDAYYLEVEEGQENYHQEGEKEGSHQKVEEGQEDYHQEVEGRQKDYHQGQEGNKVISTLNENIASEEENKMNQSGQKDSDQEQSMVFSLNIIPNNFRFTSENGAEEQEQSRKLPEEATETCEDEIQVREEDFENVEQNNDNVIFEEKDKEQEVVQNENICPQPRFPLEHECENLLLEKSKPHVVFVENMTEKYNFDGSTEKHLTEVDEMEAASNPDNDNSKSEDSMDSQDISIYSQKSEDLEISKDYQLEQTLPDTTPLPNLDDEFEDLTEDEIILASQQSAEVTKSQSPVHGGAAEELLDSSLESQSSQILPEVNEQPSLFRDGDAVSDYNEQQNESAKDLFESEHSKHFVDLKLNTDDTSASLNNEEPAAEQCEDPIDSKMHDENSESEESTTCWEDVPIFSPPEDQVQLSSEQLISRSVDEDHKEQTRLALGEDMNTKNVLTETIDFVPSSERNETELAPSLSHEDTTENENYILKEQSDLIIEDFGLEQTESVDTEAHEGDFYNKEDKECDVDLRENDTKEPSIESLDGFSGDNIISSYVPDILNEESKVQSGLILGTYHEDIKVDVKPSGESSEYDDSVTSDESSPNVSTISYGPEEEGSKTQCSEKGDIGGDSVSKKSRELEQNDPLLTSKAVLEEILTENIEHQISSDEEKDILGERSNSPFDSNKEQKDMSEFAREYSEHGKTVNGIFGHTIVQATLDLNDHMSNGHSTGGNSEIIISEANTIVRLDEDRVNSQSQDKIEDSVIEFTMSEGKSEGLFQSLLESSEHKESRIDEAAEIKNIMQTAVKYVDSAAEESHFTKKLINPYLSERDLDDPSDLRSSVIDEDLVNTKQEVNEMIQGLKINQEEEESWSSDE